jgi:hypothetical protein
MVLAHRFAAKSGTPLNKYYPPPSRRKGMGSRQPCRPGTENQQIAADLD